MKVIALLVSAAIGISALTGCADKPPHVSLETYGPPCDTERCTLPTQFRPALVAGQSVSQEKWLYDGDDVTIVCKALGNTLQNVRKDRSRLWYGIVVPSDKLATTDEYPNNVGSYPSLWEKRTIGYVNSLWIRGTGKEEYPTCPDAESP